MLRGTTMNDEHEEATENPAKELTDNEGQETDGGEFKITVRKLELPVRPRGVLAE
jgi:hypothetical protein